MSGEPFPIPKIESVGNWRQRVRRLSSRMWIVTLICLVLAIVLTALSLRSRQSQITVRFRHGHGIKPGDLLRYRGIDVGEVRTVRLGSELNRVEVLIALETSAQHLAREGSRFWIERPRLSLSRISGLETVVGSKHIAVLPPPRETPVATVFDGQEMPPTLLDEEGFEISIRFRDGYGLDVGDPLKHRGIVVGEVTQVELEDGLKGVSVRVRLRESARALARVGSQFWVERPKVSLTSVRGLETLVGGRYLAVVPGPDEAAQLDKFDGLDMPPGFDERLEGGLEVILESDQRYGLEVGAPVTYRGMPIGRILSVGLAADAAAIESRIYVQPAYKQVLRDNSRFWSTSGLELSIGIGGIQLNAETLATIAAGGVAFATPNLPGKPVSTGHRFTLVRKPENEWVEWRPHLLVGGEYSPAGEKLPTPLRAALRWREKRFGFERSRQRDGWLLLLTGGRLLGPASMFVAEGTAMPQSTVLEVAGAELKVGETLRTLPGNLAVLHVPDWSPPAEFAWPDDHFETAEALEDCLATTGPAGTSILLPKSRMAVSDGGWSIDPGLALPVDAHGASVVSTRTGRVVGILSIDSGRGRVSLLDPGQLPLLQ